MRASARRPVASMLSSDDAAVSAAASSSQSARACRQHLNKKTRRPRSVRRNCSTVSWSMAITGAGRAGRARAPGSGVRSAARSGTARNAGRWPRRADARGGRYSCQAPQAHASIPNLRGATRSSGGRLGMLRSGARRVPGTPALWVGSAAGRACRRCACARDARKVCAFHHRRGRPPVGGRSTIAPWRWKKPRRFSPRPSWCRACRRPSSKPRSYVTPA